ncbi:polysaccharide lyase [Halosquirtibacter xylanolyticus]|uniref:heparin lyase I family protein n=1 Tax=Halosquirtibacter xylanolyticus TaxID=3374599 RepID=UPI003749EB7C|nr:polysaccharide lyase [Prolixibacteraceae bacterium]
MISWIAILFTTTGALSQEKQNTKQLLSRLSAQKDIAKRNEIIDNKFIIIGNKPPHGIVSREVTTTDTIYHFQADNKANRIEFTTCFASEINLKGVTSKKRETLSKIKKLYKYSHQGNYGDLVTYEWSVRFPEKLTKQHGGIFAQWHGRPDRSLLKNPRGELKYWNENTFASMLDTMYFKKNIGYSYKTKRKNGWQVEQSAGGPIGAFIIKEGDIYLIMRSDANRMSDPSFKVRPKPFNDKYKDVGKDGKFGSVVYENKISSIAFNQWIKMKVEIKYSTYSKTEDLSTSKGRVKVWINNKMVADWKGYVGKNDIQGPYFKFGIYKPKELGLKVDCKNLNINIETK